MSQYKLIISLNRFIGRALLINLCDYDVALLCGFIEVLVLQREKGHN